MSIVHEIKVQGRLVWEGGGYAYKGPKRVLRPPYGWEVEDFKTGK
jgi:hypothetical protein